MQLETDYVLFRGDFRMKLPLAAITGIAAKAGVLSLKSRDGTLALWLGPAAEKWATRIASPKSRVEKLGVKAGARVSVIGVNDPTFIRELKTAGAGVSLRARQDSDQVYLGIESASDLAHFAAYLPSLLPDGAIWAIRRKGLPDATEAATVAAAKAAGLVDVKVARFSKTHTAEKFVRPLATRAPVTTSRASSDSPRSRR